MCKTCKFNICRCDDLNELYQGAPMGVANLPGCWPMKSDGLSVHPDQIPEAMEEDRKNGIASEYANDGRMIIRDKGQFLALCKSLGKRHKGY